MKCIRPTPAVRRYRTVLVPIDGSPTGSRGLRQAIALAKAGRARLLLLHVVDESAAYTDFESGASADLVRALVREGHRMLKRAQALAGRHGKDAHVLLRESVGEPVAEEIVRQAKRLHCDLIVMGTHARRRAARRVAGSRGARVARDAPVPVLLVPQRKLTRVGVQQRAEPRRSRTSPARRAAGSVAMEGGAARGASPRWRAPPLRRPLRRAARARA